MSLRRALSLGAAILMAVAAVICILKAKPAPRAMEEREPAAVEETGGPLSAPTLGGEESAEHSPPPASGEIKVITEREGETTRLVFMFPDPVSGVPASPPSGIYDDIRGHWVLEMLGAFYGISNCHLLLEEDATISSPGDYAPVFEVSWSEYRYEEAKRSFEATLSVALFMGTGTIPLDIRLSGKADDSLREITGSFDAVPLDGMYFPYGQQGGFRMYR